MLDKHLQETQLELREPTVFRDCLKRVIPCCDSDSARYALHNILVQSQDDRITLVATNARTLAISTCESPVKIPEGDFFIPVKIAKKIAAMKNGTSKLNLSLGPITIETKKLPSGGKMVTNEFQPFDATWIEGRNGEATGKSVRKTIDVSGRFPPYENVIPKHDAIATVHGTVEEWIEQLDVDGKWDFCFSQRKWSMKKSVGNKFDRPIDGECKITLNVNMTLGWLKKLPKVLLVTTEFFSREEAVKFTCGSDMFIQMPISEL